MVGIIALKNPNSRYKLNTFKKADIESVADNYSYEIGYAFTKTEMRGNGINRELSKLIIDSSENNIFATTGNKTMKRILIQQGMKGIGKSFKGTYNDFLEIFIKL